MLPLNDVIAGPAICRLIMESLMSMRTFNYHFSLRDDRIVIKLREGCFACIVVCCRVEQGMGFQLLAAGRSCLSVAGEIGDVAILINAKPERTTKWFESFGAVHLDDAPLSLILPIDFTAAPLQGPCGGGASSVDPRHR